MENIGGIDNGSFSFESGKLNLIEAGNSSGKSSVIRALTGILSVPSSGIFSELNFKEALKLGIKTDPRNPFEGFVNIHANQGKVELNIDGDIQQYIVNQNGETIEVPRSGEERFLLAGVLSNNSRVLRQLRGLDEKDPDNFKWAVEELSHAKNYTNISEVLKTQYEDFEDKLKRINIFLNDLSPLKKQESQLEIEISKLDSEIASLTETLRASVIEKDRLKKSQKAITRLTDEIQKKNLEINWIKSNELDPMLKQIEEAKKKLKKFYEDHAKVEKNIKELNEKEKNVSKIEKEVKELMQKRNNLEGILNLYLMAETSIRNTEKEDIECPLCHIGYVEYNVVMNHITSYRTEREEINKKIIKNNQEVRNISIQLNKYKEVDKKLKDSINEENNRIEFIKRGIKRPEENIKQITQLVKEHNSDLSKEREKYESLVKIVDEEGEKKLSTIDSKKSKLQEERGRVKQKINDISSFEIYDIKYPIKNANNICEKVVEELKSNILFFENIGNEEREQAANRFNERINNLLVKLNLQEFRTVRLTGSPNYRLYVERFDSEKKEYRSQSVSTLSTSEKLAIAMILQIALKETYLKNIPFIIVDDVLEDFDPDRRDNIIDYLKNKAKDEDWFIIATKLVETIEYPKINII